MLLSPDFEHTIGVFCCLIWKLLTSRVDEQSLNVLLVLVVVRSNLQGVSLTVCILWLLDVQFCDKPAAGRHTVWCVERISEGCKSMFKCLAPVFKRLLRTSAPFVDAKLAHPGSCSQMLHDSLVCAVLYGCHYEVDWVWSQWGWVERLKVHWQLGNMFTSSSDSEISWI